MQRLRLLSAAYLKGYGRLGDTWPFGVECWYRLLRRSLSVLRTGRRRSDYWDLRAADFNVAFW